MTERRTKHARALVVVLLLNVAALAVGEFLATYFHVPDRMNGFPRRLLVVTDDPDLPYHLRPSYETVARGMHVRTNAHGLRGPEVSDRPAPGVHRILALGGSTTFGEALGEGEAWPAVLERILEARTGEPYEVLNGGVEGYNTTAELAFLRQRGLALEPETVVVGFSLDDGNRAPAMGPLGILDREPERRVPAGALSNRSNLYLALKLLPSFGFGFLREDLSAKKRKNTPRESNLERYLSNVRKTFFRERPPEEWSAMVEALRDFGEEGRRHGLRVLIAILPDADQVHAPEPDLHPQEALLEICALHHLECLDLRPALEAAPEPLFLDGVHPNPAGYRVIAEAVAERLLSSEAPVGGGSNATSSRRAERRRGRSERARTRRGGGSALDPGGSSVH